MTDKPEVNEEEIKTGSQGVVSQKEKSFLSSLGVFFLEMFKLAILSGLTIGLVRYFLFKPFR